MLSEKLTLLAMKMRTGPLTMREAYELSTEVERAAEACERLESIEKRYEEKFT